MTTNLTQPLDRNHRMDKAVTYIVGTPEKEREREQPAGLDQRDKFL